MVAAVPRLPCSCVGNSGTRVEPPLARHGRLTAVRVVDPVSRPRGRRDPVVVGGRRRLLRRSVCAIWRLPSSPVRRAGQPGRATLPLGRRFSTGGVAGGGDLVRAKSLAGHDWPTDGDACGRRFPPWRHRYGLISSLHLSLGFLGESPNSVGWRRRSRRRSLLEGAALGTLGLGGACGW
ncbi:hypothetical protein VPH35_054845 [Triticum aestivum]|uniref:Uncharacterized protein n=1 Tax=Triticum aestivum TaxID=4565 RepID=A0A077S6R1_WHEAT|nr:unnamed protein product [Triticum aestivum]